MRRKGQTMTRGKRKQIMRSIRKQRQTWGGHYSLRGMVAAKTHTLGQLLGMGRG